MYNVNNMNKEKKVTKKKIDKQRYVSTLIILSIVIPSFFLTGYGGTIGIYIGSVCYMVAGGYAIWETLVSFGYNKFVCLIPALSIISFFLVPFNEYQLLAENEAVRNITSVLINSSLDWKPFIITIACSLIPVIAEPNVSKGKMGYIGMSILCMFIGLVASIFFKGSWAFNIHGLNPLVFFLLIAVLSDTFGYFGGKYLGIYIFKGKKLAPKISPNKTWAGAIVGFNVAFSFAVLYGYYEGIWDSFFNPLAMSFIMALTLSILSPLGDLLFSAIKRSLSIKDFSNLLPGHGGIFDRIDGVSIVTIVGMMSFIFATL